MWYKHCTHLRHPCIKVLIDERIDCLPTPRRLGAVLLTPTILFPSFNQLGQCIQLCPHSCLPFHVFERNNYRGTHLGFATHRLLGSHMAIYLHGRRPAGVTERLFLVGRCQIETVAMACPLPTKSSDAKSSELYTMNHHPYLPEPAYLHDFGQESGEKEKTLVGDGSLGILRALLYLHNLRKERKGNRFPPPPHDNAYLCVPWRKATGGHAH